MFLFCKGLLIFASSLSITVVLFIPQKLLPPLRGTSLSEGGKGMNALLPSLLAPSWRELSSGARLRESPYFCKFAFDNGSSLSPAKTPSVTLPRQASDNAPPSRAVEPALGQEISPQWEISKFASGQSPTGALPRKHLLTLQEGGKNKRGFQSFFNSTVA